MNRREFITLLGGAAAMWPGAVWAQQSATKKNFPTVGWLVTGSPTSYRHSLAAFRDGLTEAGYLEGQNIRIEYRWAEGNVGRLPELARDLVHQQVDVILAGGSVGAEAAKRATSIIPIVAAGVGDLVELGLVGSLARPNGNLTGFIAAAPETAAKRFQMVKEIKPEAKRAAVLWNSNGSNAQLEWKVAKEFADANGLTVILYDARDVPELTDSLARIKQSPPDVLVNLNDPFLFTARKLVVDSVREMRVPGVYGYREYAEDGGLISYGTNIADTYRSAARYVDKIFKGVQPADLPVQLPTKYELIINLKTAKAPWPGNPPDAPRPRRRGDRIVAAFAALHMSLPGTFETSTDVRYSAAFGGNPDSEPTLPQGPSLTRIVLRCVPSVTIEPIVKCYTWQNFL